MYPAFTVRFSTAGSPLQDLVLDEAARLADAGVRDLVLSAAEVPGPFREILSPAFTNVLDPFGLLGKSAEDERVLAAARTLTAPLVEVLPTTSDEWAKLLGEETDGSGKLVRYVARSLWERRQDAPLLMARLMGRILLRGIDRVEQVAGADAGAAHDSAEAVKVPAGRPIAATLVTGGLAALSAGLVAVAPETQRGVVTSIRAASEPAPQAQPARTVM